MYPSSNETCFWTECQNVPTFSVVRSEAAENADEVLGPAVAQVEHEDDERNLHQSQAQAQR